MKTILLSLFTIFSLHLFAQIDYFPPINSDQWDSLSFDELGWCDDQLDELLQFQADSGTKAFLILKDGKIVVEEYFQDMEMSTLHQWNSAGKTITSLLIGIAQENGLLSIQDKTSDYLGTGWTSLELEKEDLITIRHQLTMTTGMDDLQFHCVDPSCLTYVADAGTRWSYHNGPYTLLTNVLEAASGQQLNAFNFLNLQLQTGINGGFLDIGDLEVYVSNARGMARMGSLMLNQGVWNNTVVLGDQDYLNDMMTPSQDLNQGYGYLWWLSGSDNYMLPGSQFVFPGSLTPNAPIDLYSGLGKNGQFLDILPSENVVVIRMGDAPDDLPVPTVFHNQMWEYISAIICNNTSTEEELNSKKTKVFPNPFEELINIETDINVKSIRLLNVLGRTVFEGEEVLQISVPGLIPGIYFLEITDQDDKKVVKRVVRK